MKIRGGKEKRCDIKIVRGKGDDDDITDTIAHICRAHFRIRNIISPTVTL